MTSNGSKFAFPHLFVGESPHTIAKSPSAGACGISTYRGEPSKARTSATERTPQPSLTFLTRAASMRAHALPESRPRAGARTMPEMSSYDNPARHDIGCSFHAERHRSPTRKHWGAMKSHNRILPPGWSRRPVRRRHPNLVPIRMA